ncbi:glycosyltransferase, partial [Solimonas soli]|uniref:glycosyltransferase n=1 Tax=Solimonas soli TaxID=413479 RepID=UPI0004AF8A46
MHRIALISEHASPLATAGSVDSGGQNVYVSHLARQLGRRGYGVDVFTRRDRPFLPTVQHWQPNVRVIHVPAGPARFVAKEALLPMMGEFSDFLLRFCRETSRPYDLLHANFFMSGLAACETAQALDIPLVMTFHALGLVRRAHQAERDGFPDQRFAIERELVRRAARIVAECPQDHADLRALYDADAAKLDIVPCGFDPQEFAPLERDAARAALGWEPRRFTILQLGRIVPRKGIDNVIGALALLVQRGVDAELVVVGGNSEMPNEVATPELGRLARLACELGVRERVRFIGRRGRERLHHFYCASDVFVTTPWYEPFGITPVEAMACGVPVIGAAVGGIRTTVRDGVTGLLVPPRDPQALADRLAELAADPARRAALGAAGRRRAWRHYTWQRVATQMEAVYARALRSARRPLPLPAAVEIGARP